jgi:hypothetical protein
MSLPGFRSQASQNYTYAKARRQHNPFLYARASRMNAESNLFRGGYGAMPPRLRAPKLSSLIRWGR